MLLRRYRSSKTKMLLIGMFFLAAGSISLRLLPKVMPTDTADGLTGLLYGLAIGCLVVSLILGRRGPQGNGHTA